MERYLQNEAIRAQELNFWSEVDGVQLLVGSVRMVFVFEKCFFFVPNRLPNTLFFTLDLLFFNAPICRLFVSASTIERTVILLLVMVQPDACIRISLTSEILIPKNGVQGGGRAGEYFNLDVPCSSSFSISIWVSKQMRFQPIH
ncbi:Protein CBG27860 [Caenorhabditis briggsae]|uniref:Protein CBG27860 n=1 Tax=Caenorhabditis briggsae TaxID=6238 RepID=B6IEF5_CAEBR|nr:Protein CBG27860 [Caenorhabditis briggsae]CAR98285.1 Protein CBG27860 [Caenorhabditis briggsae]